MMLDTTRREIPAFVANVHTAVHIDGRTLDRQLRKCSSSQRAVIADDLRTGRMEVGPLTGRQARLLTGVSYSYANIASKLTDLERLAVRAGGRKLYELASERREPTPVWFDRLMKRYPTQVMAAIDRWTAPSFSF